MKFRDTYKPVTTSNGCRTVEKTSEKMVEGQWQPNGVGIAVGEVNCQWEIDDTWSPEQSGWLGSQIADLEIATTPIVTESGIARVVEYSF